MVFKRLREALGAKAPQIKTTEGYLKWRELEFQVDPERVGVSRSDAGRVYGVIADIGQSDVRSSSPFVMSHSAFPTGQASFVTSLGGGAVGLGNDPRVAPVAQEIVQIAQGLLPKMKTTQDRSLPEPGFAQIFLLTPGGLYKEKGSLDQLQSSDNPFLPLITRFRSIRHVGDEVMEQKRKPNIKALYAAAFTPELLDDEHLRAQVVFSIEKLKGVDPTFKRRMEALGPRTQIRMGNYQHHPDTYTPAMLQTMMGSWLHSLNVAFHPAPGDDFFLHGVRDPDGSEYVCLFYFDIDWQTPGPD